MGKATGDVFELTYGEWTSVIFVGVPEAVEREQVDGLLRTFIAINLINMDTRDHVQVWEMPPSAFKALNEIVELMGQKSIYHVKQCDDGVYSFLHDRSLTPVEIDALTRLELFDLTDSEPEHEPKDDISDRLEKLEAAYAELLLLVESISFAKAGDIHSHAECPF
jgi:hypothetical protein